VPRERAVHGQIYVDQQQPDIEIGGVMVKGAITRREYQTGEIFDDDAMIKLHEMPSIEIRWDAEAGEMQLAFVAPRGWWDEFIAAYKGSPEQHEFPAWTAPINRRQSNYLIRTIRRARNAAFGVDE
jgi:hypothetical protein